ncbi:MAG: hypothetical protein Q6358_04800 [Candidatus Brocadiales bacterium]|nr:hypothetical protein [Candidatus Brocadiales bacterium]
MRGKEFLISEIEHVPEPFLDEVLDSFIFLKQKFGNKMKNTVSWLKIYLIRGFFLFAVLASGCATFKTPVSQKAIWEDTSAILKNIQGKPQNLSLQQIRDAIISNSSRLTTFRANIAMTLNAPDLNGPVRCTGLILYQNPNSLRAIGSKFATTLFDISSDGNKFWLHVPLENKVYTGTCNAFHRIEALGINIFPGDMASLFNYKEILEGEKPTLETWPAYWLIHMLKMDKEDVNLKGNLLVDRVNGEVFRCELFNPDGSIRLQAVFTNYVTYRECRIPQRIDVRWPAYDTTFSITFSNIVVNGALDPKVFTLATPKGAQAITLD